MPAVVELPIVALGALKLGWFSALNASQRNSRWPYSPREKTLPSARLTVTLSGALRVFLPVSPNVPVSGREKQPGLNHSVIVRFDRTPVQVWFGRVAWPRS